MTPQRASWRRRAIRAAACLLLGAMTTVGAAWGAVFVHPWGAGAYDFWAIRKDGTTWIIMIYKPRGPIHQVSSQVELTADELLGNGIYELQQPFASFSRIALDDVSRKTLEQLPAIPVMQTAFAESHGITWTPSPSPPPAGQDGSKTWACAIGWPALALTGSWTEASPVQPARFQAGAKGTWRGMLNTRSATRALPCAPLWPGFLLDVLAYAAAWWALLVTPGAIRRWRRRRRGACLVCGYDLRGLPGGTVLRTVTEDSGSDNIKGEGEDTARRAVPPTCPECGA